MMTQNKKQAERKKPILMSVQASICCASLAKSSKVSLVYFDF